MYVMHILNRRGSRNFHQGGGGSNLPKKIDKPPPPSKKEKPTKWRFSICSALVWLKFNLAIDLLSRQYYIGSYSWNIAECDVKPLDPLSYPSNIHIRPHLWQISGGSGPSPPPLWIRACTFLFLSGNERTMGHL